MIIKFPGFQCFHSKADQRKDIETLIKAPLAGTLALDQCDGDVDGGDVDDDADDILVQVEKLVSILMALATVGLIHYRIIEK